MTAVLRFADAGATADLATFVGRAKRVDPDGAARLLVQGDVLAVYVSPLHGPGTPTVLGLRTLALAAAETLDTCVSLASLTDRFARGVDEPTLSVPPSESPLVSWAGIAPPRRGWEAVAAVETELLAAAARDGVAEVAATAGFAPGAAATAALRGRVWSVPLLPEVPGATTLPTGAAFALDALGFADPDAPAALYRSGPWWRLTTSRGHVLARPSSGLL